MLRGVIAVLPFVLAACSVKLECGGSSPELTINDEQAEEIIASQIPGSRVECTEGVKPAPGAKLPCRITVDGRSYDAHMVVTGTDDKGGIQMALTFNDKRAWATATVTAAGKQLLASIAGDQPFELDCGAEPLRTRDDDDKIRCQATVGSVKTTAALSLDEKTNKASVQFEPRVAMASQVEAFLTTKLEPELSAGVVVSCGPERLLPAPTDGILRCEARNAERQVRVEIAVDDKLDVKSWRIVE